MRPIMLSAAFAKGEVEDFASSSSVATAPNDAASAWYSTVVNASLSRLYEVRSALAHPWTGRELVKIRLCLAPLCSWRNLTPGASAICSTSARLIARGLSPNSISSWTSLDVSSASQRSWSVMWRAVEFEELREGARFEAMLDALLRRAGETLSLTQAAKRLDIQPPSFAPTHSKGLGAGDPARWRDLGARLSVRGEP